jgi:hypothetical protein
MGPKGKGTVSGTTGDNQGGDGASTLSWETRCRNKSAEELEPDPGAWVDSRTESFCRFETDITQNRINKTKQLLDDRKVRQAGCLNNSIKEKPSPCRVLMQITHQP